MFCVIAAELGAAETIMENLARLFPDWRFKAMSDAEQLFRLAAIRPDVVLVSRFLPGDPVDILRRLPSEFTASHIVLLVGNLEEKGKSYVRQAQNLGLTNIVTGKLPGDRPYTLFAALTQARQDLLEIEGLEWKNEEQEDLWKGEEAVSSRNEDKSVPPRPENIALMEQADKVSAARHVGDESRDRLTGCFTRRSLENACLHGRYTVVFIDLDNFKPVNDILGHEAGDIVLAAFGRMLVDNLKGRDMAVRWGGDEFVLVLPDTPQEGAERVVEKLRKEWRKAAPDTGNLRVDFSCGISSGQGGEGLQAAIRAADREMYTRKQEQKQAPLLRKYFDSYARRPSEGKFVPVVANKGGVGKTTAAIALSILLARYGVPTCLCDFDFGGPNIAPFFDIKDGPGIEKLAGRRDPGRYAGELLVKVEDNLMVLPGPMDKTLPFFEAGELADIVDQLSQDYLIVGDTPPEFWTKPWLEGLFPRADLALAVVDQSKFSEIETRDYAPKLIMFGIEPAKIRIVCNRFSANLHNVRKVEAHFNAGIKVKKDLPRVVAAVPEDWEGFVKKGYRKEIAGLEEPNSPWKKLAEEVAKELGLRFNSSVQRQKKSLFSFIKRGLSNEPRQHRV